MHGGLSEDESTTLDDIRKIDRNRQPPESGENGLGIRITGLMKDVQKTQSFH